MTTLTTKLFREARHMSGQLFAIVLVIGAGIANYVAFQSTHSSLVSSQQAYYASSNFADVWVNVHRAPESLRERMMAIDGVTNVETRVIAPVVINIPGSQDPASGIVTGVPVQGQPILNKLAMKSGRWFSNDADNEVIVSYAFALANKFREGDTLHVVVNGRWKTLTIIGSALSPEWILELVPGSLMIDNKRYAVMWMSNEALATAYDMKGAWNSACIDLAAGTSTQNVLDALNPLLERYGSTGAMPRADQMSHKFLNDEITQLTLTALIVPLIFLGVAVFLLNISLLRFVATQRSYIAILKAFGYTNTQIAVHYIGFALIAVAGGTIVGLAAGAYIGVGLVQLYLEFYRLPVLAFTMPPFISLSAVALSTVAAVLGAVGAVQSIVRLPPAEAMRPEAPRGHQSRLLDTVGIARLLSPRMAMIARNVLRRPMRAAVSILALSLAMAILVLGRSFTEMFDSVIDMQFNHIAREDAMVTFMTPKSHNVIHDLSSLPGVMVVEPFRAVAIDLMHGNHVKRTVVTTADNAASLHRVISITGSSVTVPVDGVLCSTFMAGELGIRVGDTVRIRQIDERRDSASVVVTDVVDDMMGVQVYASAAVMSRIVHEQGSVSGAYLQLDPRYMREFYAKIRELPSMSGVMIRERAIRSFDDNYMQYMDISTYYIVFFASLISFGVVFNNARIALSERGVELASLRILGLTRGDVTMLILGEQWLLIAVALPIGSIGGTVLAMAIPSLVATDLFRFPFVASINVYTMSAGTIIVIASLTGLFIWRRIARLNMISVLKSRE